jgi:hypothetical protein
MEMMKIQEESFSKMQHEISALQHKILGLENKLHTGKPAEYSSSANEGPVEGSLKETFDYDPHHQSSNNPQPEELWTVGKENQGTLPRSEVDPNQCYPLRVKNPTP